MANHIERPRFSCALSGALTTVTALPRGIPVLHAAPGCAGNTAWTLLGGGGLQTGGYCATLSVPCSNVQENEVVFGGAERLREQLRHTFEVMDGDLYVVITGCVPAMIGDDVRSIVEEFRRAGKPIIVADTGGFKGTSYEGYDEVLKALFRQYVKCGTPRERGHVNLWGIVPTWDPFWRGNLSGVRGLLRRLGLRVNSLFTHRDSLLALRKAARAELNIVLSDVYGIEPARLFESVHGTPFLSLPMPIGPTASASFLRQVGKALDLEPTKVEKVIADEQRTYFAHYQTLADVYSDMDLQRYAVVIGDANYAVALPRFLASDLGWLPELVVHTDILRADLLPTLAARQGELPEGLRPAVVFETDTSQIQAHADALRSKKGTGKYQDPLSPAFVLGSSLDRPLASRLGAGHLSVSFPVANRAVLDRGYTGYAGGLRLTEDLFSVLAANR